MTIVQNILEHYFLSISSKFSHEETSEMGYRADFEILIKNFFESINVKRIDHDPKAKLRNKPDFVVLNYDIPILYIETKDIGTSLDKVEKSEQMTRYYGYTNLVLTDYVEFRFYRNGLRYVEPIKIADYDIKGRTITPVPENYEYVAKTLLDFTKSHKEPIRSGKHLSKIMGGKAQRIRDNVRQFLSTESDMNVELVRIYETIKKLLVHDLTRDTFADMYAQTLVYGLFAARYHDESQESFSRHEARDLIPNSNPLLRHFFDHIVGPNFDKRLEYIVNELCEVFSHANIQELMKEYFKVDLWGQTHSDPDPVIHFYEDFLKEYDPELRKKMGAYYTPLPVVQFIVRSVDYLLKKEFGLTEGLADTSKTADGLHRVQILDPAVGTGTFISKIIRNIYEHLRQTGQEGRWHPYVLHDLLPRLYGFELMMTPYTIAHLKLSIAFKETGFKYFNNRRLGIYLTNSLEESTVQEDLFTAFGLAESIAEESKEASIIKSKKPIMIVVGNPPYSGVSSNETGYANSLVKKYKVEPGGKMKLQERKHWLNDDYVKFMAFAENMVEKNGEGIVGFITNHGYLDNPTFRGMRWHLMETFDEIYVLDLHGNANKREISPDGSKDENVFAIGQGVAIMFAIRAKTERKEPTKIYHFDMWGKRKEKFDRLDNFTIENLEWTTVNPKIPNLFFVPERSHNFNEVYDQGFSINQMFFQNTTGIVTARDNLVISENKDELLQRIQTFVDESFSDAEIRIKFFPEKKEGKYKAGDSRGWKLEEARKSIKFLSHVDYIKLMIYRPFDVRFIYYHPKMVDWGREKLMKNFLLNNNIGLIIPKQLAPGEEVGGYVTKFIGGHKTFSAYNSNYYFPLYIYTDNDTRIPNFKKEIVDAIEKIVGKVSPEIIFDYIYAILHSPSYREKYKEFLKIDFPRIPYPKDTKSFKKLVALGTELRKFHLLESPKINEFITTYPIVGSDIVEKLEYKDDKVFINREQYFGGVAELAWNFYVGGYQPAQKWLKDRKSRSLTNEDIEHYQKIIVVLTETSRLMREIDEVLE